ncbi:MAG: HU family DNA-binding protein [Lysobacter sp.]|nr:HU family DNA-binding protein [Lysobacter sp.]MDQ3269972.1 HU family DNA-binding protein [Pseudomonadota bacterium]
MNKSDLISAVSETGGLSKADAANAVDALIKVITETLKKGEAVTLVGFGTFEVRSRAERQGRNPKTGEAIKINASNNPAFKAGKALKDAVN